MDTTDLIKLVVLAVAVVVVAFVTRRWQVVQPSQAPRSEQAGDDDTSGRG